jgi:hypothetical protein
MQDAIGSWSEASRGKNIRPYLKKGWGHNSSDKVLAYQAGGYKFKAQFELIK